MEATAAASTTTGHGSTRRVSFDTTRIITSRSHFAAYHLPLLRLLPLALALQSWACSADGTISDASTDNAVTSDGGSGAPDLGPDAPLDQGAADQGRSRG